MLGLGRPCLSWTVGPPAGVRALLSGATPTLKVVKKQQSTINICSPGLKNEYYMGDTDEQILTTIESVIFTRMEAQCYCSTRKAYGQRDGLINEVIFRLGFETK